jgi:hypothetical protein
MPKKEFECDEAKALSKGFQDAIAKGKLFNSNTWKKKRENERIKLKIQCPKK